MKLSLPQRIDTGQWLQRMGVKGKAPDDLLRQMNEAESKLMEMAMPRGIYRIMPKDAITQSGEAIKKHLDGCDEIAIMGVTLGALVDTLIRTSQIKSMAEAFVIDCGASVLVEQVCDDLEEIIRRDIDTCEDTQQYEEAAKKDINVRDHIRYMTPRYSPGYGDYPIQLQTELIWLMDAHRKIGLTVNKNYMMTPLKSVTAVIGISGKPVTGYLASCEECIIKDNCVLRKEGKNCAGL